MIGILGLLCSAQGCKREPRIRLKLVLPVPHEPWAGPQPEDGKPAHRETRRQAKKKRRPVPLYADGAFKGMVKYHELPPEMPTIFQQLKSGKLVYRFAWVDLFEAQDIDLSKIQMVQFYGGNSLICLVKGDEIRRLGRKLRFSFSRGTSGHVRMEFPPEPMEKNVWLDRVVRVAVYLDKEPPTLEHGKLYMPDGKEVSWFEMPYSGGERHGGTRVYVDGVFKGSFQRRALTNAMQVDPTDRSKGYSLSKALAAMGVSVEGKKRIVFTSRRDDVLGELGGDRPVSEAADMVFQLPQHSSGRAIIDALGEEKIEAITMYESVLPNERPMPQLTGSLKNRLFDEKANHIVEPYLAQAVQ